ncbi:MAG: FecR domain-containing protein [Mucilaginibacter sp.]|nr:FecR domain-containing protein [Mucilaginibacter sp.]
MDEIQFRQILKKYLKGEASQAEIELLHAYYDLFEQKPDASANVNQDELDRIKNEIRDTVDRGIINHKPSLSYRVINKNQWLKIAALFLVLVSVGVYALTRHRSLQEQYAQYDIKPGTHKITLTLSNGEKLEIDPNKQGQIVSQQNTSVRQQKGNQLIYSPGVALADSVVRYNNIDVPGGLSYQLVLADGSKVYLNAGSSLRYPVSFSADTRTVELSGEAYFEVAHDAHKPFIVKASGQQIKVLGTHFNVKAYADEPGIKTSLLSGSVQLAAGNQTAMLKLGEESFLSTNRGQADFKISLIEDLEEIVAWKNGYFQYDNADLKTIMADFSRWYGIKVKYEGKIPKRTFSGAIHKNLSLLQALDILDYTDLHIKLNEDQLVISDNYIN